MLEISHIGRYMYKYMNLMSTSLSQIQLSQHDGIIVIIANVFQLSQMCHEGFFYSWSVGIFKDYQKPSLTSSDLHRFPKIL